jgi:hypothetical protein
MGKVLVGGGRESNQFAGANAYGMPFGRITGGGPTEAFENRTMRTAGKFSNFGCAVNNVGTARSVTYRKNSVNQALTLSFTDTTTETKYDTTHTVSYAAGDTFNIACAGSVNYITYFYKHVFQADVGHVSLHGTSIGGVGTTSTCYCALQSLAFTTTEGDRETLMRTSGSLKFAEYVISTAFTASATLISRKNGANGNISVVCTANNTGSFADNTHSDTFASGDKLCFQLSGQTPTSSGGCVYCDLVYDNDSSEVITAAPGWTFSASDQFISPLTAGGFQTTESLQKIKHHFFTEATLLRLSVLANSMTGTATVAMRKNGADGNLTLSIPSGATGWFEDTTHTDSFIDTDDCNLVFRGGTSGTLTPSMMSWVETPPRASSTFAGSSALSARTDNRQIAASTFAGLGNLSARADSFKAIAATLNGAGLLSANLLQGMQAAATFNGVGSLLADVIKPAQQQIGQATFAGLGLMSAAAVEWMASAATLNGLGLLSVDARHSKVTNALFAGAGSFSITSMQQIAASATFAGLGSMSVQTNDLVKLVSTIFGGVGTIQIAANLAQRIAETLAGSSNLQLEGIAYKFLSPDADSIDGGWTNEADGTILSPSIDEMISDDSDFIKSSQNPAADICKISLSDPTVTPAAPFAIMYRYKKVGTDQIDLTVRLLQGTTQIAAWSHPNIGTGFLNAEQLLTNPEFATITDFNNLFVEFNANKV